MARPASVAIEAVGYRYPRSPAPALADVSFRVAPGERLGLLGPNGAGKSTLMRLVCGLLVPARGRVEVAGFDATRDSLAVRARLGYMPETVPLYPELRVREHLAFRAAIKRVARREAEIDRVLEATGTRAVAAVPIGELSRGYRQRVGIADALLGAPPLLILDEPTVGLDPNQVLEIRAVLREVSASQTLIFSSHILAEVEALCDRVVILHRGRVVADEPVRPGAREVEVTLADPVDPAIVRALLEGLCPEWASAVRWPSEASVTVARLVVAEAGADALRAEVGRACLTAGVVIAGLRDVPRPLEARFAALTGGAEAEP